MASPTTTAPSADPSPDRTPTRSPDHTASFAGSVLRWVALMIAVIGGLSFAGITLATGSWVDGAVVAGFLSTFIAPALGGLFAGVLWCDRQDRDRAAPRPVVIAGTPASTGVRRPSASSPARAA